MLQKTHPARALAEAIGRELPRRIDRLIRSKLYPKQGEAPAGTDWRIGSLIGAYLHILGLVKELDSPDELLPHYFEDTMKKMAADLFPEDQVRALIVHGGRPTTDEELERLTALNLEILSARIHLERLELEAERLLRGSPPLR